MRPVASTNRSPRRSAAIGVVAATLTVAGAAYAVAGADRPEGTEVVAGDTAPPARQAATTPVARVQPEADDPFDDHGYTQARSDAFWGAGYVLEDADALAELWGVDLLEAKGRAGQMLLDGQVPPVAPGSSLDLTDPQTIQQLQLLAYWDAGYTGEDGEALAALWNVDVLDAKASAGQMLRDGQSLPIPPSGTPAS